MYKITQPGTRLCNITGASWGDIPAILLSVRLYRFNYSWGNTVRAPSKIAIGVTLAAICRFGTTYESNIADNLIHMFVWSLAIEIVHVWNWYIYVTTNVLIILSPSQAVMSLFGKLVYDLHTFVSILLLQCFIFGMFSISDTLTLHIHRMLLQPNTETVQLITTCKMNKM